MMKEKVNPEDLQCCGNCMEFLTCGKYEEAYEWCKSWQWDSMTQSKREKERTGDDED